MNELLALADLLEEWAGSVPHWDPQAGERWDLFADRRFEAERALRARLRRLPTCVIRTDPALTHVEFALAGIGVEPRASIDGACRAWAAEARRRARAQMAASGEATADRPAVVPDDAPAPVSLVEEPTGT